MRILFDWLLPQNFLPYWHCYLWRPDVLWLHVSSDAVIAASLKQAEAALAARTDELHQTFNATATGLMRCSRNLHYIAANPAYAEIAGMPLQQIEQLRRVLSADLNAGATGTQSA